jgi:hypothetical protein
MKHLVLILSLLLPAPVFADLVCVQNNMCCAAAGGGGAALTANTFTGNQTLDPGVNLNFGGTTTAFGGLEWNTTQTPDTLMLLTGSTSNHVVFAESADAGFDFGHAQTAYPTFFFQSAAQSLTQWGAVGHDGTNFNISKGGTGSFKFIGTDAGSYTTLDLGQYARITYANANFFISDTAKNPTEVFVGVGSAAPTGARLSAGISLGTDVAGGNMTITGGYSAGLAAPSLVKLASTAFGTASGSGGQTSLDRVVVGATKVLTNNTVTAVTNAALASNTTAAGQVSYSCEVFDATDLQIEQGQISYIVTNKGGVIANNTVVKYGNQQAMTAGTLTVTWTITAASPAVLSVNCNSSLTPSTGYPRVVYELHNLTNQAVAIQ